MSELRESGDIEQDASQIILLWNLSPDNPSAKGLVVCKNRMGNTGRIGYKFCGDYMTFEERFEEFYQWEKLTRGTTKIPTETQDDSPNTENPFD